MTLRILSQDGDGHWREENSKHDLLRPRLTLRAKALITGRCYRLLNAEGRVIDEIGGESPTHC